MNWWRASKRPEDHALEPEAHPNPESKATAHQQNPVLLLQRAVGNRAVQKMLPRSEGDPIAQSERLQLETAFGQDLSEVRIHRDEDAGKLAADAGANAFTTGRDIYFAPGAYGSAALAHEVSHVIQQGQAASFAPGEDALLEHQADVASSAVMSGQAAEISGVASAPAMQRQAAPGAQPSSLKLLPSDSLTLDSFDIDKFALSGTHKQQLDEFAKRLKSALTSAPDSIVTIVGFADAPGTEPHNLALGQQRADTVRDYLVAKGIAENQLHATSLGESLPLVMNKGYEARNRRVEIDVVERSFFKPSPIMTPPSPVPAPPPKGIDLKYHPEPHDPTPDEDLQERLRQIDKAVREARPAEKAAARRDQSEQVSVQVGVGDVRHYYTTPAGANDALHEWLLQVVAAYTMQLHGKDKSGEERQLFAQVQYSLTTRQWTVSFGGQESYVIVLPANLQLSFWAQLMAGENVSSGTEQKSLSVGTQLVWQPKDWLVLGGQVGIGPTAPSSGPSSIDRGALIFFQIQK